MEVAGKVAEETAEEADPHAVVVVVVNEDEAMGRDASVESGRTSVKLSRGVRFKKEWLYYISSKNL